MPLLFIFLLFFLHAGTGGIHKFLLFLGPVYMEVGDPR